MDTSLVASLTSLMQRRVQVERRQAKRVPIGQRIVCLINLPEQSAPAGAILQNLSVHGAALLLDREYPAGSCLQLVFINAASTCALRVGINVVRSGRAAEGPFFLGGTFDRTLRHEDLVPFMM